MLLGSLESQDDTELVPLLATFKVVRQSVRHKHLERIINHAAKAKLHQALIFSNDDEYLLHDDLVTRVIHAMTDRHIFFVRKKELRSSSRNGRH